MLDKPKREETIFYNGILFRKGDIVTVKTRGTYGKEHTGRIFCIDILNFQLDMSEKYHEDRRKFEYDDISYIKYAEEPNISASADGSEK